jgi:hypothetical protein
MERTLTALDRCDVCDAPAYVKALFSSGYLLFCAHHWSRDEEKVNEKIVSVVDERDALYPNKQEESEAVE